MTTDTDDEFASVGRRHDALMKNSSIVMVDDEPLNMEVLQVHLESEGYINFVSISDSTKALQLLRENPPDIVLLDLMMPLVSGFEILEAMRADPELKYVPVVVLTSSDDSENKLKALRLGANDFLSKPVDASELALRLRNTLIAQAYQHKLTHFDSLTGLPNRKYLEKKLADFYERSQAQNSLVALLLINLDRFKSVNDSHGREMGDAVLQAFSRRLQHLFGIDESASNQSADFLRSSVVSLGGDKFCVLLPFIRNPKEVLSQAKPFLDKMDEPLIVENHEIYLTCSIGITIESNAAADGQLIMTHAETAMVHAKQRRHNSYAFYAKDMDAKARQLLDIENGMRTALDDGEFFLVYQPKVCVVTEKVIGCEALVRWQHPKYGMVSPDHFIALAEDSGLIVPIGDFVLNEACRQNQYWREHFKNNFKVAINVSVRQLHEESFTLSVQQALERHDLPPEALKIELTENMIMDNAESNMSKLQELKDIGVSLSVDDFGTGYSSLSYLQIFPLDELKVDKSFIQSIQSPEDKAPIVKAVVSLAHDLGLTVVAEGVENDCQLAYVRALNCEEFQGYLCSSPLVAEEFEKLIINANLKAA